MDLEELAKTMFEAAWGVMKDKAPSIRTYAEGEFKKIAQTVVTIEKAHLAGEIKEEEARILLDMQKSASRSVLLTAAGLQVLVAEQAINAALAAAKPIVNGALGFLLL